MNLTNFLLGIYFTVPTGELQFLAPLLQFLNDSIVPISITLFAAAAVFSVIIAFMIMKAENSDKADDMKKRLRNLIICVICVVATLWLLGVILPYLDTIITQLRS